MDYGILGLVPFSMSLHLKTMANHQSTSDLKLAQTPYPVLNWIRFTLTTYLFPFSPSFSMGYSLVCCDALSLLNQCIEDLSAELNGALFSDCFNHLIFFFIIDVLESSV